ncbi:MAG: hypothetical protein WD063_14405 [Pirellulales bacterium]
MSEQVKPALIESVWREIKIELEGAKSRIYEEIRSYPPPITACDEQFDRLLEEREKISRELERMRDVSDASLAERNPLRLIDEFLRSSIYIGAEAEQRIRALTPDR